MPEFDTSLISSLGPEQRVKYEAKLAAETQDTGRDPWVPPSAPPKGAFINLASGERFTFQFNPEGFTESISVNYTRHTVPGLGFQIAQYLNTNNHTIPLGIYLSAVAGVHEGAFDNAGAIVDAKNFLQALAYPTKTPHGGWKAPPLVMFIWPSVVRMVCIVTSVSFAHRRFSSDNLKTLVLMANVTLEEYRTTQKYSEDVRRYGSAMGGATPF